MRSYKVSYNKCRTRIDFTLSYTHRMRLHIFRYWWTLLHWTACASLQLAFEDATRTVAHRERWTLNSVFRTLTQRWRYYAPFPLRSVVAKQPRRDPLEAFDIKWKFIDKVRDRVVAHHNIIMVKTAIRESEWAVRWSTSTLHTGSWKSLYGTI